jgi:hypothetical protein
MRLTIQVAMAVTGLTIHQPDMPENSDASTLCQ